MCTEGTREGILRSGAEGDGCYLNSLDTSHFKQGIYFHPYKCGVSALWEVPQSWLLTAEKKLVPYIVGKGERKSLLVDLEILQSSSLPNRIVLVTGWESSTKQQISNEQRNSSPLELSILSLESKYIYTRILPSEADIYLPAAMGLRYSIHLDWAGEASVSLDSVSC